MLSTPPDFEALYRADADPWRVGGSFYEQRKLEVLLASLSRPRYACAWDPACGTGHLSERLARRADSVVASDLSAAAAQLTAARCADLDNVTVTTSRLPQAPRFATAPDVVVLSEVFYYLADGDRADTITVIDERAAPLGEVVAVHWNQVPHDAYLGGPAAQQDIVSRLVQRGWTAVVHHEDEAFVLDVVRRGSRA